MDDEEKDAGNVFAIPDLWAPSKWLLDVHDGSGLLFSELRLDGLFPPFLFDNRH
jgi:hypothetical protein